MIRCVGGYLDNVMVPHRGDSFVVLDNDEMRRVGHLPKGHPDMKKPVKYHEYKYRNGVYIHSETCCPTRTIQGIS